MYYTGKAGINFLRQKTRCIVRRNRFISVREEFKSVKSFAVQKAEQLVFPPRGYRHRRLIFHHHAVIRFLKAGNKRFIDEV
jgi:hypothetical protein